MAPAQLEPVLRHVRTLVKSEGVKSLSDGDLVRQFVTARDEAAFAEMLRRHGPMVRSVCRRVLGHEQDAEDAFQATFLVLARRAASIRQSCAVGAWMYRVAHRIAMKAGHDMTRRRLGRDHAPARSQAEPPSEAALRELDAIIQEEVNRLPEKLRAPFLLCCLEGKTGADAARQLGWKEGTVSGRLTEARKLLKRRLGKRGVSFPAALCVVSLAQPAATAALPASLARATLKAAVSFANSSAPDAGIASGGALALAERALRLGTVGRVFTGSALLLMVSLLGLGAGLASQRRLASPRLTAEELAAGARRNLRLDVGTGSAPAGPAKKADDRLDRFGDPLPEGALARFGTVRLRQGWMVSRVLFSPDGKQVALAGIGRPLGLWDVATGKQIHQFHQKNSQPSGIAFSPDGAVLAEGDQTVRIWDTRTGALRRELPAAQESQRAVVFSPDGKILICGGHDNLIHLWNPRSGQSVGKLAGHTSSVLTLAVTQDGSTLASGGSDKTIRLWDLAGRKQVREIKGLDKENNYFNELSFSPNGRWLASAEAEGNAPARVWDVRSGKERFRLSGGPAQARSVAFADDGSLIASGHGDGAVRLWNPETGKQVRHWRCPYGVRSLAFSPKAKMLATISIWDSGPRLWDTTTGAEIRKSDTHRGMIREICLTRDGKALLSLGQDRQLLQWDLVTKTPKRLMELPLGTRWNDYYHELSPDGRVLAEASRRKRTVTLVNPQTGKPLRAPLSLQAEPYFLRFSPDGRTLAIGGQKGGFYLWSWQDDGRARRIETPEKDMVILHLFTPDGKQLITGSFNQNNVLIHLWDVATGKRVFSFPGNDQSPTCALSPDGRWAVGATWRERAIHVFDVEKRKEVRIIPLSRRANALAFSPDGQVLAHGEYESDGGSIGLLEFATGQRIASFDGQHSGVSQLLFSSDGRSLFSGAGDSTIVQWDATGRRGKRPLHRSLPAAWEALAGEARVAYPARWDFLDAPEKALALFRDQVRPIPIPRSAEFAELVKALDSGSFTKRQKAARAIRAMGLAAEPLLRKELEGRISPEVRLRLQALHEKVVTSSTWQRARRVLTIVSALRTADARAFLEKIAEGHPDAMLTVEARNTLARMSQSQDSRKRSD
jgi:RNA polymerase sigma factor (sigma-70 family)